MQHRLEIAHGLAALGLTMGMSCAAADSPAPSVTLATAHRVEDSTATTSVGAAKVQIWECVTHGVRTFSSHQCGAQSTLRDLNPINLMQPVPPERAGAPNGSPTHAAPAANNADPAPQSNEETYADADYSAYPGYSVHRVHRLHPKNARNHPRSHRP